MFASWNKARTASLVAAAAAVTLMAAPHAMALEGIQGRHAIFYPSIELIYQHDDNYFLSPSNEVSADTFVAHAHFVLEVPGARQYLRMEYEPQFRNVNVSKNSPFELADNVSHFWNLQAKLKGSAVFGVDIDQNLTIGNLEVYEIDDINHGGSYGQPGRELVGGAGERFMAHGLNVAFKWEGSKQSAKVIVGKEDTGFDDLDDAPAWFELDEWRLGTEYAYKFAPLTNFLVGFHHANSTQDYTQKYIDAQNAANPVTGLDSTRNHLYFGFDGEMGRTTTGRAQLGFISLDYDTNAGDRADYDGVTLMGGVTKSFSRWTKLAFNADRRPYFSGFTTGADQSNNYYIANTLSFTLANQPQGGRVIWELIGQFQRNGYDVRTDADENGTLIEREDDIGRFRAMIGFHPIEHLSFRLNYQHEKRDSTESVFEYTDNQVIFQVQFGF